MGRRISSLPALWALVAVVTMLLGITGDVAAQTPPPPTGGDDLDQQLQVLAVEEGSDRVVVDVALPAAIAERDLADRVFTVADGERELEHEAVPLGTPSVVLTIDTSGSMKGHPLEAARTAARTFVETLPADAPVGLVSFGDAVTVHKGPTLDRAGVLAAISGLDAATGTTVLWDGLVAAAGLLDGLGDDGASVVVLSDGGDRDSGASRNDAVRELTARSTLLYAVAIETPELDRPALKDTVTEVGGQFLAIADVGELDSLYADIAGRLANRYRVSFAPPGTEPRPVTVAVAADGITATATVTLSGRTVPTVPSGSGGTGTGAGPGPPVVAGPPLGDTATVPPPGLLQQPHLLWIGAGASYAALLLLGVSLAGPGRRPANPAGLATATGPGGRPANPARLATASGADRLAGLNASLGWAVEQLMSRHDRARRLDARLDAADLHLRPGEVVLAWLMATTTVGVVVATVAGVVPGLLVVPLSAAAAHLALGLLASRRRTHFANQLTETLGILGSSLRAGQSLPKAVELVASEAPSPTADEFRRIHFEVRVGRDLTESMRQTARRMESDDLEWLAHAIDVHRELGGDLTEILSNLAATIRERRTVARQVEALTAEGRATGWLLLAMPALMFLFTWWRTPENIATMLGEPLGRLLLGIAAGGMVVGHLWIRQLVKPKF